MEFMKAFMDQNMIAMMGGIVFSGCTTALGSIGLA